MDESTDLINLYDFEARARERLAETVYAYYASGANDEITLRENHAAYDRIALRYHVLRDVSRRDLSTTVLGERVSMPVLIAPLAFQGMAHPDGEVATTRAAAAAGTIMVVSTLSNASIEEVAAASTAPPVVSAVRLPRPRSDPRAGAAGRGGWLPRAHADGRRAGARPARS